VEKMSKKYKLKIVSLQCIKTSEPRKDEIFLRIYCDGIPTQFGSNKGFSMSVGRSLGINRDYPFDNFAEVQIWESDFIEEYQMNRQLPPGMSVDLDLPDKLIGSIKVSTPTSINTKNFTGQGANYKLTYSVDEQSTSTGPIPRAQPRKFRSRVRR
jgi:hypothetical protein